MDAARSGRLTALGQGAFWLAAGLWPLAHYRSFEAVTGPKRDDWVVKTIGGLIAVVGATLLRAGARRRVTPEIALLGAASAATLAAADLIFVRRGRISRVYLLDVVAEAPFLAGWAAWAAGAAAARRAHRGDFSSASVAAASRRFASSSPPAS